VLVKNQDSRKEANQMMTLAESLGSCGFDEGEVRNLLQNWPLVEHMAKNPITWRYIIRGHILQDGSKRPVSSDFTRYLIFAGFKEPEIQRLLEGWFLVEAIADGSLTVNVFTDPILQRKLELHRRLMDLGIFYQRTLTAKAAYLDLPLFAFVPDKDGEYHVILHPMQKQWRRELLGETEEEWIQFMSQFKL